MGRSGLCPEVRDLQPGTRQENMQMNLTGANTGPGALEH